MTRTLHTLTLGAFALLAAGTAAGQGGWLEVQPTGTPPRIFIYAEGGAQWDFVDRTAPLVFNLRARGRCSEDHHMREARICAGYSGDVSCIEPAVNQGNRSFSADEGKAWQPFTVSRQYLSPKLSAPR